MGTAFAHSRSKTTILRQFRALFGAVSAQKKVFLMRYVTIDETWIHHYIPVSNRQSAKWTAKGDYFEKGRTIDSEYYMVVISAFDGRNC